MIFNILPTIFAFQMRPIEDTKLHINLEIKSRENAFRYIGRTYDNNIGVIKGTSLTENARIHDVKHSGLAGPLFQIFIDGNLICHNPDNVVNICTGDERQIQYWEIFYRGSKGYMILTRKNKPLCLTRHDDRKFSLRMEKCSLGNLMQFWDIGSGGRDTSYDNSETLTNARSSKGSRFPDFIQSIYAGIRNSLSNL